MYCIPYVKEIGIVPNDILNLIKLEADTITADQVPVKNRVFYKVRGKSFNVSKYSEKTSFNSNAINTVVDWVLSKFPDHSPFWANIFSMNGNQRYPVHVDGRNFHFHSKRIHIPIEYTDSYHIHFFKNNTGEWESISNVMQVGNLYEFDNITPHSAENLSSLPRKVFVVDVINNTLLNSRRDWLEPNQELLHATTLVDFEFSKLPNLKRWTYKDINNEDSIQ